MWSLKILSGSQTGQVHDLKSEKITVGREPSCDIPVSHPGISRQHFQLSLENNMATIKDLGSVNGTFVNGVLIKSTILTPGDKIACNDMIFEFNKTDKFRKSLASNPQNTPALSHAQNMPSMIPEQLPSEINKQGDLALSSQSYSALSDTQQSASPETTNNSLFANLQNYFEDVVMPGVYALAKWAEFRWVLGGFVLTYVFLVTVLSVFPLMQISKERILKESLLRAVDIGQTLAQRYRSAMNQGLESTFVIQEERLEGVSTALIIASDGHILAPARKIGTQVDLPFIHNARKKNTLITEELQDNTIGVSVPIRVIDSNTGDSTIKAFSMLIYNVSSLKSEDVIRLFVQVLAYALLIGFILFALFYRLIEYPIKQLNLQIDQALKEGHGETSVDFKHPEIQKLSTNINSTLSRISHDTNDLKASEFQINPADEAQNLIRLIKESALVLDGEGVIIALNSSCENLIGDHALLHKNITDIADQALQLNLKDLFQRVTSQPDQMATNELEFSGINYTIEASIILEANAPKFVIVIFSGEALDEGDF